MQITILRESLPGEARVALLPEFVKKLLSPKAESKQSVQKTETQNIELQVESGAGSGAFARDSDYEQAGALVSANREELLRSTDVLLAVNRPAAADLGALKRGAVIIGFLRPLDEAAELAPIIAGGLTAFAMELVPRSTRAQAMDALSSMATIAGYKAVLLAADSLPRIFPMMITAAGTISPGRVLVLGAGVAGLQAIATARRLGAMVEAYDVRAAAGEQVRSLGAKFLEVDLGGLATEDSGGYARELTEEALNRGRELIAKHARSADAIITTAQVPGKRAPLLVTEAAVAGMKPGSVVIDLAAPTGGNCALTKPGENIARDGVTIMAPLNLAAAMPVHASQLYSRNVSAFLGLLIKDGQLAIDLNDNVVGPTCVALEGEIKNPRVAAALGARTTK